MDYRRIEPFITMLFYLVAIAAIVVYFAATTNRTWFFVLSCIALLIRIGQYIARFFYHRAVVKKQRARWQSEIPPVDEDKSARID